MLEQPLEDSSNFSSLRSSQSSEFIASNRGYEEAKPMQMKFTILDELEELNQKLNGPTVNEAQAFPFFRSSGEESEGQKAQKHRNSKKNLDSLEKQKFQQQQQKEINSHNYRYKNSNEKEPAKKQNSNPNQKLKSKFNNKGPWMIRGETNQNNQQNKHENLAFLKVKNVCKNNHDSTNFKASKKVPKVQKNQIKKFWKKIDLSADVEQINVEFGMGPYSRYNSGQQKNDCNLFSQAIHNEIKFKHLY